MNRGSIRQAVGRLGTLALIFAKQTLSFYTQAKAKSLRLAADLIWRMLDISHAASQPPRHFPLVCLFVDTDFSRQMLRCMKYSIRSTHSALASVSFF
jgi:hypothetical protein